MKSKTIYICFLLLTAIINAGYCAYNTFTRRDTDQFSVITIIIAFSYLNAMLSSLTMDHGREFAMLLLTMIIDGVVLIFYVYSQTLPESFRNYLIPGVMSTMALLMALLALIFNCKFSNKVDFKTTNTDSIVVRNI